MTDRHFTAIQTTERKRYIAQHAPAILCALIRRRAGTEPSKLIDLSVEVVTKLFDEIRPFDTNGHDTLVEATPRRVNASQPTDRKRYILVHAPVILCALIQRRDGTEPEELIDMAITTAGTLYDEINPLNGSRMVLMEEPRPDYRDH